MNLGDESASAIANTSDSTFSNGITVSADVSQTGTVVDGGTVKSLLVSRNTSLSANDAWGSVSIDSVSVWSCGYSWRRIR